MLHSTSSTAVQKALEGVATRLQAIAGNLANAETPGYRPRRVAVEQALRDAIDRERAGRVPAARPDAVNQVRPASFGGFVAGGEPIGVEPEVELTQMARDALHYEALARTAAKQLRMLRAAITGGAPQ